MPEAAPAMGLVDSLGSVGLALAAALSILLLTFAADQVRMHRRAASRLERFGLLQPADDAGRAGSDRADADVLRRLGAGLAGRASQDDRRRLHTDLVRAGVADRVSAEEFLGLRVLSMLVSALIGALLAALFEMLVGGARSTAIAVILGGGVVGGALGALLPPLGLARLSRRRRETLERLLPNAVDVLVVSLEAGLSFDSVVRFLCERADNPLVIELRRYLADLRLGRSRREALLALVERTRSPGLRDLAAAVMQADELGTGLARALRGLAVSLRAAQRVRAEELARQAPIKLLFPIVLCIMPALFIVIIGPALLLALTLFGG